MSSSPGKNGPAANNYPTLTGQSLAAVKHRDSHMQIIACAGSGKTEVVAQRTVDLLVDGVLPNEIVAFTFNERAAQELKGRVELRVEQRLGRNFLDKLNGLFVDTIHAYCFRLLQTYVSKYETYDVLDDHRLAALLVREADAIGIKNLTGQLFGSIRPFLYNVDVTENELISADVLVSPFKEMVERFLEILDRYRFLTYGQIIARTIQELQIPEVFDRVHGGLKYLIVDEYQDINPAQEQLISMLSRPPVNLCVVGDDDQSIYQWRGADVNNIVRFTKRYAGVKTFRLTRNRRSRREIVQFADHFATNINGRLPKKMTPQRLGPGPHVTVWIENKEADEAQAIASAIRDLRVLGYRFKDMAVLVRSSASYRKLIEAFESAGIPVAPQGRTGLFRQPEAQLIGKTFAFLAGIDWKEDIYSSREQIGLDGLIDEYASAFALNRRPKRKVKDYIERWCREVEEPSGPANLIDTFYELLVLCGIRTWDLDDPVELVRIGTLARFSNLLADYENAKLRARPDPDNPGQQVGGVDRGSSYYFWLAVYVQNWALGSYEAFEGERSFDLDAVDLTTIHQAKGLEWPIVFVPCLSAKRFPSSYTGQSKNWYVPLDYFDRTRYEGTVDDERRLFYVALTRARDWVSVSSHNRIKVNRVGRSQFLSELWDPRQPGAAPNLPKVANQPSGGPGKDVALAISLSELMEFAICGYSYRLRRSVGFQPKMNPALGYGKAVHHVLRRIAEYTKTRGKLPVKRLINETFDSEFYVPFASKPAHMRMKRAGRRIVNQYLTNYSDDLFRIWELERPFELHLDDIILSGRADVILDREGGEISSLAIVDYKTGLDETSNYEMQLQVYSAAGRKEGMDVRGAYLHDLKRGARSLVDIDAGALEKTESTVQELATKLQRQDFSPSPSKPVCKACDMSKVCRYSSANS